MNLCTKKIIHTLILASCFATTKTHALENLPTHAKVGGCQSILSKNLSLGLTVGGCALAITSGIYIAYYYEKYQLINRLLRQENLMPLKRTALTKELNRYKKNLIILVTCEILGLATTTAGGVGLYQNTVQKNQQTAATTNGLGRMMRCADQRYARLPHVSRQHFSNRHPMNATPSHISTVGGFGFSQNTVQANQQNATATNGLGRMMRYANQRYARLPHVSRQLFSNGSAVTTPLWKFSHLPSLRGKAK